MTCDLVRRKFHFLCTTSFSITRLTAALEVLHSYWSFVRRPLWRLSHLFRTLSRNDVRAAHEGCNGNKISFLSKEIHCSSQSLTYAGGQQTCIRIDTVAFPMTRLGIDVAGNTSRYAAVSTIVSTLGSVIPTIPIAESITQQFRVSTERAFVVITRTSWIQTVESIFTTWSLSILTGTLTAITTIPPTTQSIVSTGMITVSIPHIRCIFHSTMPLLILIRLGIQTTKSSGTTQVSISKVARTSTCAFATISTIVVAIRCIVLFVTTTITPQFGFGCIAIFRRRWGNVFFLGNFNLLKTTFGWFQRFHGFGLDLGRFAIFGGFCFLGNLHGFHRLGYSRVMDLMGGFHFLGSLLIKSSMIIGNRRYVLCR